MSFLPVQGVKQRLIFNDFPFVVLKVPMKRNFLLAYLEELSK